MKKKDKKIKNKLFSGFTLVETLVAISIFTMSILGLMSVLASGISNTGFAKKKMQATYLAQEGIEYVRNQRDTFVLEKGGQAGWEEFWNTQSFTLPINATDFPGFVRTLTKTGSGDEVTISSKVEWTQSSGNYEIIFSENLFNWIE